MYMYKTKGSKCFRPRVYSFFYSVNDIDKLGPQTFCISNKELTAELAEDYFMIIKTVSYSQPIFMYNVIPN